MTHPEPVVPALELLARFRITLEAPLEFGDTHWGRRRVIPVAGGEFDGPRMSGRVLPGGADWQIVHADGMATIDTRYTLEASGGELISVATSGVRTGPPEVLARLARGEAVDPSAYYFRVSIRYETAAPSLRWLNQLVAVASAVRLADMVIYDAYALT
ncbi:MAG: DUF3237 domain-containing protein [Solirubrobacterales bacterium]|nr:DUF3237 domain-containing protein [Solirubrobacterales bacterium]MBV9716996.1 DUF3237 domain-containing protein [Solirubrobacterales bacterium]